MSAKRAPLTQRLVIRISDDLDAWIGEQAALEGLDNATWARATLTRLMNGIRPSPVREIAQAHSEPEAYEPELEPDAGAMSILESRVSQLAQAAQPSPFLVAPPAANDLSHELVGAAQPLRRVDRVKYNPGRGGHG